MMDVELRLVELERRTWHWTVRAMYNATEFQNATSDLLSIPSSIALISVVGGQEMRRALPN